MSNQSVIADVIDGALATRIMGKVTTYLYEHEKSAARERED